jgi:hypothetical protein
LPKNRIHWSRNTGGKLSVQNYYKKSLVQKLTQKIVQKTARKSPVQKLVAKRCDKIGKKCDKNW